MGLLAAPREGRSNGWLVVIGAIAGTGPWLLLPVPWVFKVLPFLVAAPALLFCGTTGEMASPEEMGAGTG